MKGKPMAIGVLVALGLAVEATEHPCSPAADNQELRAGSLTVPDPRRHVLRNANKNRRRPICLLDKRDCVASIAVSSAESNRVRVGSEDPGIAGGPHNYRLAIGCTVHHPCCCSGPLQHGLPCLEEQRIGSRDSDVLLPRQPLDNNVTQAGTLPDIREHQAASGRRNHAFHLGPPLRRQPRPILSVPSGHGLGEQKVDVD
mmetsp:Transcript_133687/g.303229  ORF Transcript_133687/g.303229 Transcript_133687/m.303229 type:complete len:200 (+) Transcript_133687:4859-5458(+)